MTASLADPLILLVALLAAAGMGFAIQQGGTCMVSALDHLVARRSTGKLAALAECGIWTSALGLGAAALGLHFAASPSYGLGFATVLGGLLLGAGAWLNGACVFGSIARIGGRDWHYLLTPPGYLLGALAHAMLRGSYATPLPQSAPVAAVPFLVPLVLVSLAVTLAGWRRSGRLAWDYRHATIAIGFTFVALALLAGPWTYTEVLSRAAHGKGLPHWNEVALFTALLGGAIIGGRGLPGVSVLAPRRAAACLAGGVLMGIGGSMIPGGNDNLILVGLPGLQPHAWVAIAAMALAIIAGLLAPAAWRKLADARTHGLADRA